MDGVVGRVVGYAGGGRRASNDKNPTYQNIQDYTEALLVEYNPDKLSYRDVLQEWSAMDYPFVRQTTQYRSAIFTLNDDQQREATDFVQALRDKYHYDNNTANDDNNDINKEQIYVDVEPITKFYRGEEYHQDFLVKQRSSRTLRMF